MAKVKEKSQGERRAILVLGMHRSGTSALTSTIEAFGAATPKVKIGVAAQNPRGFFEAFAVARLNDEIMEARGIEWSDVRAMPRELSEEERKEFSRRATSILNEEFGDAPVIVLKDPRNCRLVPFWRDVLRAANFSVSVALISRPPEEVAASLTERNGFNRSHGINLWMRNVLEAERETRGMSRTFLRFNELLSDGESVVRKLSDLGLADASPHAWEERIDSTLRHHCAQASDLPPLVAAVDDIFSRWAADAEAAEDHARLDVIHGFDTGSGHSWLDRSSQFLLTDQLIAQSRALGRAEAALGTAQQEVAQLGEVAEALRAQVADLEEAARRYTAREAESATERKALSERIRRLEKERLDLEVKHSQLRKEVNATLGNRAQELDHARQAIDEIQRSTSWRVTSPLRAVRRLFS